MTLNMMPKMDKDQSSYEWSLLIVKDQGNPTTNNSFTFTLPCKIKKYSLPFIDE